MSAGTTSCSPSPKSSALNASRASTTAAAAWAKQSPDATASSLARSASSRASPPAPTRRPHAVSLSANESASRSGSRRKAVVVVCSITVVASPAMHPR
ncbi:hypothetical protein [Arsenicicoccus piscis]|uniref:hypothetical protein n=1 Tax=Arsenicicoccus piscis TaxID=673954 RepID=UPI0024E177F3|nr:hypothetical protein [Arsenicicoccus piscis]